MAFTTVIFGNGLGRAINNEYFTLNTAIAKSWRRLGPTLANEKLLMLNCLPGNPEEGNIQEQDLQNLHQVANGCIAIKNSAKNSNLFLTDGAEYLDRTIDKLISETGWYFHQHTHQSDARFTKFGTNLAAFFKSGNKHLATLNYDNLLYDLMLDEKVLDGFRGNLIDGFTFGGNPYLVFDEKNLERRRSELGFYLHLHGSPLFITRDGKITKLKRGQDPIKSEKTHIVLHHSSQKPYVIENSLLLASYWNMFDRALFQTEFLVIFGYGGQDEHLNKRISSRANDNTLPPLNILVVEHVHDHLSEPREEFWRRQLAVASTQVKQLSNILDFNFTTDTESFRSTG